MYSDYIVDNQKCKNVDYFWSVTDLDDWFKSDEHCQDERVLSILDKKEKEILQMFEKQGRRHEPSYYEW
jgi:hypothetical protein